MFPCFVCGKEMTGSGYFRDCETCEVSEWRQPDPWYCKTRTVKSQFWCGEELRYLNHALGSYPSPA